MASKISPMRRSLADTAAETVTLRRATGVNAQGEPTLGDPETFSMRISYEIDARRDVSADLDVGVAKAYLFADEPAVTLDDRITVAELGERPIIAIKRPLDYTGLLVAQVLLVGK